MEQIVHYNTEFQSEIHEWQVTRATSSVKATEYFYVGLIHVDLAFKCCQIVNTVQFGPFTDAINFEKWDIWELLDLAEITQTAEATRACL